MMQPIPGGAVARPFVTHHNALDMRHVPAHRAGAVSEAPGGRRLRARVRDQPQLPQRGLSTRHNPEFTMLELYLAYADYQRPHGPGRERMCQGSRDVVLGTRQCRVPGRGVRPRRSRSAASRSRDRCVAVQSRASSARGCATSTYLRELVRAARHRLSSATTAPGKLQIEIFEKTAEHTLLEPTFVYAYPAEVSPLSRAQRRRSVHHRPLRVLRRRAASSPTASPSSTIRKTRPRASGRRSRARTRATKKRCTTTPTTSARSSTACRRPPGSASASTGW